MGRARRGLGRSRTRVCAEGVRSRKVRRAKEAARYRALRGEDALERRGEKGGAGAASSPRSATVRL